MAKSSKTKTAKKRVKVGKLPTTKTKLTGKDMKKVRGGDSFGAMQTSGIKFDGVDGEASIVARKKPIGTA